LVVIHSRAGVARHGLVGGADLHCKRQDVEAATSSATCMLMATVFGVVVCGGF
jgi:hypothetical protein